MPCRDASLPQNIVATSAARWKTFPFRTIPHPSGHVLVSVSFLLSVVLSLDSNSHAGGHCRKLNQVFSLFVYPLLIGYIGGNTLPILLPFSYAGIKLRV